MTDNRRDANHVDRRGFLQAATAGLTTAGAMLTPRERALAQSLAEKSRFERMAGCTWPIRSLFKTRQNPNRGGGAGGRAGNPPAAPAAPTAPTIPAMAAAQCAPLARGIEVCPKCCAEIKERPLFVGTYFGCLC